ncbi:hypothetical protein C1I60_05865 [Paenibacillus terrae]|uniref:Uncharacterized protein n=1 Tax=Paenibacillus terrae TaxID=159743 RepID=A0A4U2Q405_9BACL|nr:hypothetical protein C1I60_05865 [Paenibacillus terrae]
MAALMEESIKPSIKGNVKIVQEPFEELSIEANGWKSKFDLVFASMCPAISVTSVYMAILFKP